MLDEKLSPLSLWFERELPDRRRLSRAYRARLPEQDVIRPHAVHGTSAYGTIGEAIDHRLRCALASVPFPDGSSIERGARLVSSQMAKAGPGMAEAGTELLGRLHEVLREHKPWDRRRALQLDAEAEDELDRVCFVAACFEEVYRSGAVWPGSPLAGNGAERTLNDLIDSVPDYAVADIAAQVAAAEAALGPIRSATKPEDVRCDPSFVGSRDVRNADADLVADGFLIEIKARSDPGLKRQDIYQLAGYLLLDYDDEYQINQLGWYQTRLAALVSWDADKFLALLGSSRSLPELRELLRVTLSRRPRSPRTRDAASDRRVQPRRRRHLP